MDSEYLSSKTKTLSSTSCDPSSSKKKDHSSTSSDLFSFKKKTHSSINSKHLSSRAKTHLNSGRTLPKFLARNRLPRHYGDRFIPNRSAMDINLAHSLLTTNFKIEKKGDSWLESPSKIAYRKALQDIFNVNQMRILSFKNKPPLPSFEEEYLSSISPTTTKKPAKRNRIIPQKEDRILDAPDLLDDYYLNLLDWGSKNILCIALGNTVYLWNGSDGSTDELMSVNDDIGPITSVCWAPDGQNISIGLNSSHIEIWDAATKHKLRTLHDVHESRVGSLAWNKHILTSGGKDGRIVNSDVRLRSHIVQTYSGHNQEVCGLKWSDSGQLLASGGNDNLLHIWSLSASAYIHRLLDHTAAVKAFAWCPFQANLLASGGGDNDRCIRFWNTQTGACLNSVNTGSQVCSILWSRKEREVLSAHGFTDNQLILWKYPSMVKMAELKGHTSRVLYMAQSPDGCSVVSAAGDETLRFWKVFGDEDVFGAERKRRKAGPFVDSCFIR